MDNIDKQSAVDFDKKNGASMALIDEYITCKWADERHKTHPEEKRSKEQVRHCAKVEKQAKDFSDHKQMIDLH